MSRNCKCPHLDILQLSLSELYTVKQGVPCSQCPTNGRNLWICLYKTCMNVGCSEDAQDHGTKHYRSNQTHCLQLNLSTHRIWCYICKMEVFVDAQQGQQSNKRRASIDSNGSNDRSTAYDQSDESSEDDDNQRRNFESGLIGLQNIANTCYMNAALQALSNTPPLTGYFLECGDIIEATNELFTSQQQQQYQTQGGQRKCGLARSYHRLIKDMWCRSKRGNGYIVPSGILNGIRNVHPMFRGYQQHDTQEFLRCFMDQLHEELKEQTPPPPERFHKIHSDQLDEERSQCSSPSQSLSEAEYETCDSGVSEQSSLSDETPITPPTLTLRNSTSNARHSRASSPSSSGCSASTVTTTTTYQRKHMLANQRPASTSTSVISGTSTSSSKTTNSSLEATPSSTAAPVTHRSIISDIFDGKLLSSVQCLTCDRVSTREETFQDLSLPIPGKDHLSVLHGTSSGISPSHSMSTAMPQMAMQMNSSGSSCSDAVYQHAPDGGWLWWIWDWVRSFFWGPAVSLHDCMAAFFSADELKGDNMYSCEKCKKLRNGMKYSRVLELPEMLCVHLKRFRHDLSYSSKIASPVNFPLHGLDMSAYLHRDCISDISVYDLTAVICHHGTVGGGHYTSFARHASNDKWYEYDDQLVTLVTEEIVQSCEAYVLFYRKSNPKMADYRTQALELIDNCAEQAPSDIRFFVSKQWLNRFNTFAEPGPIDNWALLCPHGALPPNKAPIQSQLVVPLPQPLWEFLYRKFGGGPVCNHLYECDICRRAAAALVKRQHYELDSFQSLKDETTLTLYAISMAWLRQWQIFVGGGGENDHPGQINNSVIAGQQTEDQEAVIRSVRAGSDYAQINSSLWRFFHGIYRGGPTIVLRGTQEEVVEPAEQSIAMDQSPTSVILSDEALIIESTQRDKPLTPVLIPGKTGKVHKNVSFEDEAMAENNESESIGSSSLDTVISNGSAHKRAQNYLTTSKTTSTTITEIVNKKDKRHRGGITSSGLFGAEGKYSSNSTHIPETSLSHSNVQVDQAYSDNNKSSTAYNIPVNHAGSNKFDEIVPLMNQTSISQTSAIIVENLTTSTPGGAIAEPLVNGLTNGSTSPDTSISHPINSRKAHKLRKKLKSKSSRRHHHHQSIENGSGDRRGSDSDRN